MNYRVEGVALIVVLSGFSSCKLFTSKDASVKSGGSSQMTVHGIPMSASDYNTLASSVSGDRYKNYALAGAEASPYVKTSEPQSKPSEVSVPTKAAYKSNDTEYMKTCRDSGVPIPPSWNDPVGSGTINQKWRHVADLPKSRIFALSNTLETDLYGYVDPDGLGTCAALPRGPLGDLASTVTALGIICQGKNGNSCFWDNIERNSQKKITNAKSIRPEIMADANSLQENCTNCHRGENIFIIHQDTDMINLPGRMPDQPANPISTNKEWRNPEGDRKIAKNCQDGCHSSMPALHVQYCQKVLMPSLKSMKKMFDKNGNEFATVDIHIKKGPPMPPQGEDAETYKQDIQELTDACRKLTRDANLPWAW